MKCLKVDEYIKRTASVKETELLLQELESYVKSRPGLQGRTLCDRVIRACNHHLGAGSPDFDHVSQLVRLVELSLSGYDISTALVAQSSPLYMEKIVFHIVKKLSSLEAHTLTRLPLLYGSQAEDYCVLVRSCFSVLWNGLSATKDGKILIPRDKLHCQLQALSFLLLLDTESATPSVSKVPIYTEDAITEFESSCGVISKDDASFLIQEMQMLFNKCWTGVQHSEGDGSKQSAETSILYVLSEMVLIVVKVLCKAGHSDQASTFVNEFESRFRNCTDCQCTAAVLGKWAVIIHTTMKAGGESGQALTECARALRSLSADLGEQEAHAVLEGCGLVVWAVESGYSKGLSATMLLSWFSFLEEHQERILKMLKKVSDVTDQEKELSRSFPDHLRVLDFPVAIRKLSRPFMLAVQTSRRAAQLERALDWVILWLKALGDKITTHLAEPVSLWVKTKTDAARNSEEDIRLRTLRDGFGPDVPDEQVMLCLLEEELRAYKEVTGDMAQERYNTLCDLLDICHEESSHTHLRAVYLCEMAQVVCYQDFSEQTDCAAVDFTHEALRLLEEEPETPENADRLKDDKAHALLWLYICTLEKNLQEVKLCKPLEKALDEWSALLQSGVLPSVRNPKQTCSSIAVTAALFKLMGKVTTQNVGVVTEGPFLYCFYFRIECLYCHCTHIPLSFLTMYQVDRGLPYLCEVLKEVNEQRQSKSWYLLRARTLQTCSCYLSLDTAALPQAQRGLNSPDTALYESLKLLCSLLVTLVGKGLYGTNGSSSDVRFIDQGDNLVLKWQLLSELLNCSMKMVTVRSSSGAINDARLQCLEALKLAIKLQAPSQCAELLVMKAELELLQGEREESGMDLDKVRFLLELCTGLLNVQKTEVKIKPRKGRPAQKSQSPLPSIEDDFQSILSTKWIAKEPVVRDPASSPPLKAQPRRWLSSLEHGSDCQCPCCSEPCLGRATARWAAAQADLVLQLDPNEARVSLKLQSATLSRCKSVSAKLGAKLAKLFPLCGPVKGFCKPSLMQDVVGRVYLRMALSGLEPRHSKVCGIWKVLEAGLAFVDSTSSPVLRPVRAGLMATKAIVSIITLAAKKGCTPEELFSNAWTWNPPKVDKELKSDQKIMPPSSLLKKPKESIKNTDIPDKTKEAKKVKVVKPKIQVTNNLSLEDIQSLLHSAWLTLQHFPSPSIYTTLCTLLALTTGQQDPIKTAMLHSQSLGITSRHRTIRHLASSLSPILKLTCLAYAKQKQNANFIILMEYILSLCAPCTGVTVCVISLLGVKPGEIGDSIILSRLEKGSVPVTVHIPTSKHWLVQEMDSIQVEQKVVSCVSEKAKWWEGRRALDSRVEVSMEGLLGCWRSFFPPLSLDPEVSTQARHLFNEEMLKVCGFLHPIPFLASESDLLLCPDLKRFALGVSPQWDMECDRLLHAAVSRLADRDEPSGHVVLILDKFLQKLPWESISILSSRSVSRMPSLHSLIGLSIQKESILKQGVDTKQVFYVLDPDANLGNSRDRFKEWFSSKLDWEGVCGAAPDSGQLEEAVATKDLYIYVGHGAGARFLDSQAVLKRQMRAASLLFGCSSAALAVRGDQEGQGIILNYLIAGCPFVLGNLWDVTDRDIDRFTKALLESWLSAGSGAPLLDYMGPSRQATHLKHLIGAAPVVYGLPVHLQ
uniref:separase n=1 Tax=Sparus aurata TaxID=8175 RepID=A0A671W5X4_SPAAU